MPGDSRIITPVVAPAAADPFRRRVLNWKDRETWWPALEIWLQPYWSPEGRLALESAGEQDLCWDDTDWLDLFGEHLTAKMDDLAEDLADSLNGAVLRVFHGCRVLDAGVFHRDGLKINDPTALEAEVRRIVAEEEGLAWMRPGLDDRIRTFDARERDTGRLYVCADETPQLDRSGHYLLYGSEWVQCVLGWGAHSVMKRRGTPTVVELDLPFSLADHPTRTTFARKLLQEWVRVLLNAPTFVPALDFSVILHHDLPASMVVGHHHPPMVKDPFNGFARERSPRTTCPHCEAAAGAG